VELVVGGTTDPWERLGLSFVKNVTAVGAVRLRVVPFLNPGLQSVGILQDDPEGHDHAAHEHAEGQCEHDHGPRPGFLDGAAYHRLEHIDPVEPNRGPLDARLIDHVVLMTPDLERTCTKITEATDAPLKRVREAPPVRQGFFRLGEVILEVVQSPDVPAGGAKWWGLVINVADLQAACERLGPDVISAPKAAVQPGRFIATVRSELGLGVPLALMSA
jgi:hypothetical protein